MLLLALFLISTILLLIEDWSVGSWLVLIVIVLLSLAGFVFAECTSATPLLNFSLFRLTSFTASSSAMFLFWLAYQGATLILGLYLLGVQHLSPGRAALLMVPVPLANVAVSLVLRTSLPQWIRAIVGILCGTIGFLGLSLFGTAPLWFLVLPALLIGAAASLCFISFHACVLSEVPPQQLGQASGVFNTGRQLATILGAAVLLKNISLALQSHFAQLENYVQATIHLSVMTQAQRLQVTHQCDTLLASLIENQGRMYPPQIHLLGVPLWDAWFSQQLQTSMVAAFSQTWLLCAALALATIPLAIVLRPHKLT